MAIYDFPDLFPFLGKLQIDDQGLKVSFPVFQRIGPLALIDVVFCHWVSVRKAVAKSAVFSDTVLLRSIATASRDVNRAREAVPPSLGYALQTLATTAVVITLLLLLSISISQGSTSVELSHFSISHASRAMSAHWTTLGATDVPR